MAESVLPLVASRSFRVSVAQKSLIPSLMKQKEGTRRENAEGKICMKTKIK